MGLFQNQPQIQISVNNFRFYRLRGPFIPRRLPVSNDFSSFGQTTPLRGLRPGE